MNYDLVTIRCATGLQENLHALWGANKESGPREKGILGEMSVVCPQLVIPVI